MPRRSCSHELTGSKILKEMNLQTLLNHISIRAPSSSCKHQWQRRPE